MVIIIMYKVLIADDEMKVCHLIEGLVSWDDLGLEVVGCVNDGSAALKAISDMCPDIVITDIRMPGYNGIEMIRKAKNLNPNIEFIIISGYKNFDYAHEAIKLGVYDYLLKPLRKIEFENTLTKITAKLDVKIQHIGEIKDIREQLKNDQSKLRSAFVTDCLFRSGSQARELSLEQINKEYRLDFANGCFQVLIIKVDMGYKENNENVNALIINKCLKIAETHLTAACKEIALHYIGANIFCILNYEDSVRNTLRKSLKAMLDNITSLNEMFLNFNVSFGVGSVVSDLGQIEISLKEAQSAINSRITIGTGRIIESARLTPVSQALVRARLLPPPVIKNFAGLISALDVNGLKRWFDSLKKTAIELEENDGNIMISICAEVVDMYLYNLRKENLDIPGKTGFLSSFNDKLYKCRSIPELMEMLSEAIINQVETIIDERQYVETRPIRAAKEYIQQNYHSALSLDELSGYVGFNATYFSHLFKKITGMNFLEYLTDVRVGKAKELLINTDQNIADISAAVGYIDTKHFSKLFKKITGLSPSEYRKFYQ